MGDLGDKAREAAENKALEPTPEDSETSLFAKYLKKSMDAAAYERIDGYVSRPEGRGEEEVRVEANTFASGIPGPLRGKLVDRLIEGAKERRKKAEKQRKAGKTELAERTEAQARNLEVAADEINKGLPKALKRKVVVAPQPERKKLPADEEEAPHPADPRRPVRRRPAILLLGGAGLLALLAGGLFLVLDGGGSAEPVSGELTGQEPVYDIKGPVSDVGGCTQGAPEIGEEQSATTTLTLDGTTFIGTLGATTEAPSAYPNFEGQLFEDGTFELEAVDYLPADIHPSVLEGGFDEQGNISGTWTFGLAGTGPDGLDEANCVVTVSPLESSFYFGVTDSDWREAYGVE